MHYGTFLQGQSQICVSYVLAMLGTKPVTATLVCFTAKNLTMCFLKNLRWLTIILFLSNDAHENPGPNNSAILH